jgi:hypothetical protein
LLPCSQANDHGRGAATRATAEHAERNVVGAANNFAEHLPERRRMMQAWADYLDGLMVRANVVPLFKRARASA